MSIIVHPLTALKGKPTYTADDYRHVVNPLLVPSNGSSFNGVQGVRYGSPKPLSTIDGLKVTVKPHCGTVSPWDNSGIYTYCLTEPVTVTIGDSTKDYKIAICVDDPSLGHMSVPQGRVQVVESNVPDSIIPGMVIARISAGSISDAAPMIRNDSVIVVDSTDQLQAISAVDGQEAVMSTTGARYVTENGKWRSVLETVSYNWLNGSIVFLYGRSSCTVQINGVKISNGAWASASCPISVEASHRPALEIMASLTTENGASHTGLVSVGSDGVVKVKNMGSSGSSDARWGSVSWPISA